MDSLDQKRIDPAIASAADEVLRAACGRFGFREAVISAGPDHDGEPALFVDALYDLSLEPVDSRATIEAQVALHTRLREMGETRFPYVRHRFREGQALLGARR